MHVQYMKLCDPCWLVAAATWVFLPACLVSTQQRSMCHSRFNLGFPALFSAFLNEAGFNFVRKCIDLVESRGGHWTVFSLLPNADFTPKLNLSTGFPHSLLYICTFFHKSLIIHCVTFSEFYIFLYFRVFSPLSFISIILSRAMVMTTILPQGCRKQSLNQKKRTQTVTPYIMLDHKIIVFMLDWSHQYLLTKLAVTPTHKWSDLVL